MKTFALAAFSLAALAAAPAFAGDVDFSYSRNDLASSARIAALYERMQEKANDACAIYENSGLFAVQYRKQCAEELVSEFVAGVGNDRLTALHEAEHDARLANRG